MLRTKYIALSTILPLMLVACGKNEDRAAQSKSPAAASSAAPAPAPTPAPAPVPAPTTAAPPAAAPEAPAAGTAGGKAASGKPAGGAARAAGTPGADTHVVARGDTLQKIAKARGVSAEDLAKWNNIDDPRRLRVGQELRLTPP